MKIYTKTGDTGYSSLYNGTRKCKNDIIFKFLGDFDELNCNLAMVKALHNEELAHQEIKLYSAPGFRAMNYKHAPGIDSGKFYEWFALKEYIYNIQINIMDISAFIATPPYDSKHKIHGSMESHLIKWEEKVGFDSENNTIIENQIDRLDSILPPLKNFVVPSGNKLLAQIHICRAIARRCERTFIELYSDGKYLGIYDIIDNQINSIQIYLNRLSDYLFMLSRFVAISLDVEEDLYIKKFKEIKV